MKSEPVRLPQLGQRNQNRSPPKWQRNVVIDVVSLIRSEPLASTFQ